MFHVEHALLALVNPRAFLYPQKSFSLETNSVSGKTSEGTSPHGRPTLFMSFSVFPFRRSALPKCLNSKSLDTYCLPKPGVAPNQHQCAKTLLGKTTKWDQFKCSAYTL